jgi:hypothetical protein
MNQNQNQEHVQQGPLCRKPSLCNRVQKRRHQAKSGQPVFDVAGHVADFQSGVKEVLFSPHQQILPLFQTPNPFQYQMMPPPHAPEEHILQLNSQAEFATSDAAHYNSFELGRFNKSRADVSGFEVC